ncbi:RING-type E3 ubiquitin transferase [Ranunculus cassubicifolius]
MSACPLDQHSDLDRYFSFDFGLLPTIPVQKSSTISQIESLVSGMPTVSTIVGVCMICMDEFNVEEENGAKEMPCSHTYHPTCISKWLFQYNSCPLCRFRIIN